MYKLYRVKIRYLSFIPITKPKIIQYRAVVITNPVSIQPIKYKKNISIFNIENDLLFSEIEDKNKISNKYK